MLAVNKGKVLMHHKLQFSGTLSRSPIPEEWLNANTFQPPSLEQEIDEYDVVFDDLWYRNHIPHAGDVSTSTEDHQEENTPQMQEPEEKKDETPEQNRNQRAMYWDIRNAFEELQGLSAHFQSSPDHAQWMVTKLHEWIHITRSYMEQQNVHDLPTSGIVDSPALPHQGPPPDRQKPMWEIVVSNGVFVSAPVPSDSLRETSPRDLADAPHTYMRQMICDEIGSIISMIHLNDYSFNAFTTRISIDKHHLQNVAYRICSHLAVTLISIQLRLP
jgi:hypothetical protein